MPYKFNPWLMVMFVAPLLVLALPFLIRGGQHIKVPVDAWLLNIFQGLFYLVTVGGGIILLVRSVWGAEWGQVRNFLAVLCLFTGLYCVVLIPTVVFMPVALCGLGLSLFFGLLLIAPRRK